MGTKVSWEKSARKFVEQTTTLKGKTVTTNRLGKNGGPCVQQNVVKVISPR